MSKLTRQQVLGVFIAGAALVGMSTATYLSAGSSKTADAFDSSGIEMVVYRSPTCGCCEGWADRMEAEGFQASHQVVEDIATVKQQYGIPDRLLSCHTTMADGYIIEGHVPTEAVQRLLIEKPDIAGIAVPGMPLGTPGMEANGIQESYTVFAFDGQGQTNVFAEYNF